MLFNQDFFFLIMNYAITTSDAHKELAAQLQLCPHMYFTGQLCLSWKFPKPTQEIQAFREGEFEIVQDKKENWASQEFHSNPMLWLIGVVIIYTGRFRKKKSHAHECKSLCVCDSRCALISTPQEAVSWRFCNHVLNGDSSQICEPLYF